MEINEVSLKIQNELCKYMFYAKCKSLFTGNKDTFNCWRGCTATRTQKKMWWAVNFNKKFGIFSLSKTALNRCCKTVLDLPERHLKYFMTCLCLIVTRKKTVLFVLDTLDSMQLRIAPQFLLTVNFHTLKKTIGLKCFQVFFSILVFSLVLLFTNRKEVFPLFYCLF